VYDGQILAGDPRLTLPDPPLSSPPPDALHLQFSPAIAQVFDKLQAAVWVFDTERKRMHWANPRALYLWNSDRLDQLLARDFASDMSRSTETRLLDYLDRFRRGENLRDRWTFYPKGSPTPVTVISWASGIRLEDGRLAMLFEAVTAEADALETESLRVSEVLRHTSILLTVLATDGRLLLQNPASLRVHGSLAEGDGIERLLASFREPETVRQAIARALGGEEVNLDAQIVTGDGFAWYEIKVLCTRDPVTSARCILFNETNIDALRVAQERNLLLERDATERRMAGGFAHEVRNALSGAKISLQSVLGQHLGPDLAEGAVSTRRGAPEASEGGEPTTLNQASLDELQRIYELASPALGEAQAGAVLDAMAVIHQNTERLDQTLQMCLGAVERTLGLTTSIMQLSKVGQQATEPTAVDLGALLAEISAAAREECAALGISLRLTTPPAPVLLRGVGDHFHSIFQNLIRNAKDALCEPAALDRPGREIAVSLAESPGGVAVAVVDNGVGIPPALRQRIFEPFFTTKTDSGTGLGLSLVRRYLDLYEADLTLESEPGVQTRFLVTFPSRLRAAGQAP
jgi:signal transduction histidine kinase